jgi:hypothetical protein
MFFAYLNTKSITKFGQYSNGRLDLESSESGKTSNFYPGCAGSYLGRTTDYTDENILWFLSVHPNKYQDRALHSATSAPFYISGDYSRVLSPGVQHYVVGLNSRVDLKEHIDSFAWSKSKLSKKTSCSRQQIILT